MQIATSQEIRNIDRRATREFGIPGVVLMENAAAGIMVAMEEHFEGLAGVRVGILCGKGNNGGDGLALARRLRIRGVPVRVALLAPFTALSGEAKVNLAVLRKTDVEIAQSASPRVLADILAWSDIVVDALLGVGLASPLSGAYARAVERINAAGRPITAIDIPTGIDADTGAVRGLAVRADLTVTMGLLKRGLVLQPGAHYAGVVRTADLGIPPQAIEQEQIALSLLDREDLVGLVGDRKPDAHKGDFGHLLVIAGSPGKAGAAIMAARSALRTGAGLVSVAAPNALVPIIQSQLFEAMGIPAAESLEGTLGIGAGEELAKAARGMSACALGPGLSTHFETCQVVRDLVQRITVPLVIDADGLNAFAGRADILKRAKAPVIVTPHPGEMGRLAGIATAEVQEDRIGVAADFAKKQNVVVVLKGAPTVVALPQGRMFVNVTGNPGMATAGTGDALTGMIGSLLAQGYAAADAACLGVYLHGRSGDLAAGEKGEAGMITGDLIEQIPATLRELRAEA